MAARSNFVLPYEPDYAGHRDAARRRAEVAEALKQREELQTFEAFSSHSSAQRPQPFGRSSR